MFATQHGRDQLRENWPKLYTPEQSANEPAEELVQLEQGADYGWPYCYFDMAQKKAGSGIRWRWRKGGWTLCRQASPSGDLPGALGA
jgi:glucose/arabinose dehydrogenase